MENEYANCLHSRITACHHSITQLNILQPFVVKLSIVILAGWFNNLEGGSIFHFCPLFSDRYAWKTTSRCARFGLSYNQYNANSKGQILDLSPMWGCDSSRRFSIAAYCLDPIPIWVSVHCVPCLVFIVQLPQVDDSARNSYWSVADFNERRFEIVFYKTIPWF